jgi:hypothetical protein
MTFVPRLTRVVEGGELVAIRLGHPLLDDYLEFVAARGATNTWLATAYDLKVFFEVIGKEPTEVAAADVFAFLRGSRRRSWSSAYAGPKDRPPAVGPVVEGEPACSGAYAMTGSSVLC